MLTSGTYRENIGESQGSNAIIDDLMKKSLYYTFKKSLYYTLYYTWKSLCITHLFLFFTGKIMLIGLWITHLFLFLTGKTMFIGCKWRRPQDVYWTQLRNVPEVKWWNILGTSVVRRSYKLYKCNSQIYQTYFGMLFKTLL